MKKIFFFALASLALASCSQDEEFVTEKSNGSSRANGALSFSTYTAGATRADVATSAEVKNLGFHVRAMYNGKYYIADNHAQIGVGYGAAGQPGAGASDIFDTDGTTYYWPVDIADASKSMRFYAYNVVGNGAGTEAAAATNQPSWNDEVEDDATAQTTGENEIKFKVEATDAKDQLDLVVAATTAESKPTDGIQPLNFVHALSKINFSLKAAEGTAAQTYIVRKIELIANTGEAIATLSETAVSDKPQDNDAHVDGIVSWGAPTVETGKATVPTDGKIFDKTVAQSAEQALGGKTYTYFAGTESASVDDLTDWDTDINASTDYAHFDAAASNCVSFAGDETLDLNYNLMLLPKASGATVSDVVAIRIYYMVVDANKPAGQQVLGNCGFYSTVKAADAGTDGVYGCKTVALKADWVAGHAYRYTLALPVVTFIGDLDGDKIADDQDLTATDPADQNPDVDADGDTNDSEFDKPTPIRFSVTVSAWDTESDSAITIK